MDMDDDSRASSNSSLASNSSSSSGSDATENLHSFVGKRLDETSYSLERMEVTNLTIASLAIIQGLQERYKNAQEKDEIELIEILLDVFKVICELKGHVKESALRDLRFHLMSSANDIATLDDVILLAKQRLHFLYLRRLVGQIKDELDKFPPNTKTHVLLKKVEKVWNGTDCLQLLKEYLELYKLSSSVQKAVLFEEFKEITARIVDESDSTQLYKNYDELCNYLNQQLGQLGTSSQLQQSTQRHIVAGSVGVGLSLVLGILLLIFFLKRRKRMHKSNEKDANKKYCDG